MTGTFHGTARDCLAGAVEHVKRTLLSRNPDLVEMEAHRSAIKIVAKGNPELLAKYRGDEKSQYTLTATLL
jgi:hypothetical protein